MSSIKPGQDGDALPQGTLIFRIGKRAQLSPEAIRQGKALPIMFKPSSEDEKSASQSISVWVEELTVADQGWAMMGSNPANTHVACLQSDDICNAAVPANFLKMRTCWETARLDDGSVNTHPGAEGHAGIWGLCQGGNGKQDRRKREELRIILAGIARLSPVPVPHDIEPQHIAVAAYYIAEKHGSCWCPHERHWILAVQQLRRARVLAAQIATS